MDLLFRVLPLACQRKSLYLEIKKIKNKCLFFSFFINQFLVKKSKHLFLHFFIIFQFKFFQDLLNQEDNKNLLLILKVSHLNAKPNEFLHS